MDILKNYKDPYAKQRNGISELAKRYPELHGFLGGLLGTAPDEFEQGSVLDSEGSERRKAIALGAKYGFPLGSILGALPFGGGIAASKAPAAGGRLAQRGVIKAPGGNWLSGSVEPGMNKLKQGRAAGLQPITPEFAAGGLVSFNPDSINKRAADLAVELGF